MTSLTTVQDLHINVRSLATDTLCSVVILTPGKLTAFTISAFLTKHSKSWCLNNCLCGIVHQALDNY